MITLVAVSAMACNSSEKPKEEDGNFTKIEILEQKFSFGAIAKGDSVSHEFKILNKGSMPLIISSAQASCGCTVPTWSKTAVAIGDTAIIRVNFKPTEKMSGYVNKSVVFQSNIKDRFAVLYLRGMIK